MVDFVWCLQGACNILEPFGTSKLIHSLCLCRAAGVPITGRHDRLGDHDCCVSWSHTHTQDIAVWKASHETSSGQHCAYHGHGGTTWHYRVTICDLPSGKLTVCCGKSASLIGKSTSINYKCAILNCYLAMWVITRDDFLISHGTPVSRYHLLTKPADSVRPRCTFAGKSSDGGVAWVNQGKLQAFRVSRPRVMVMTTNIIYKQWWLLVTIGDYSWL